MNANVARSKENLTAVADQSITVVGFDLDGTLIRENTWELLHAAAGVPAEQDMEWYGQFSRGQITYAQWFDLIVQAFTERNVSRQTVVSILPQIHLSEGCQELIDELKARYELAIVSSSVDLVVEHVANLLGIAHWRSNCRLRFNHNDMLATIEWDDSEELAKVLHLQELADTLGYDLSKWAFVGNSTNDFYALSATKLGILYWPNPSLPKGFNARWQRVDHLSDVSHVLETAQSSQQTSSLMQGAQRRPRLKVRDRELILALATSQPTDVDVNGGWTLSKLVLSAQQHGISASVHQVRRLLKSEGIRLRRAEETMSRSNRQ